MKEYENLTKVTAHEIWEWPETQAFLKRVGIDISLPTTRLVLMVDFEEDSCRAKQYYLLRNQIDLGRQ